jgi:hypothetical protein
MRGVTCSLETCSRQSGLVWRSEERGGQAPTIRQYGGESVEIVSTALPPLLCVSHTSTIVALQVEMVSSRVVRQVELDTLDKPYRPYASLDFFLLG